tara:strand:+ start:237 stop:500 length:264 start_codon:yes stop_codon:yes gene_type:complete
MTFNKKEIKKRIIYRSNYRGSKEMDFLMTSFTNKYIDSLNDNELVDLSNLLNLDDENLYSFNQGKKTSKEIPNNKVTNLFKLFELKK